MMEDIRKYDDDIFENGYREGYTEALLDLHKGFYEQWIEEVEGSFDQYAKELLGKEVEDDE